MNERGEDHENERGQAHDDDGGGRAMRELVKRSLATEVLAKDAPDLLRGVQRRIRRRSRGKFFADGWSTTGQSRMGYVLVALVTLLLAAVAYYALGPMDVR
jgi:hypothetical protein